MIISIPDNICPACTARFARAVEKLPGNGGTLSHRCVHRGVVLTACIGPGHVITDWLLRPAHRPPPPYNSDECVLRRPPLERNPGSNWPGECW